MDLLAWLTGIAAFLTGSGLFGRYVARPAWRSAKSGAKTAWRVALQAQRFLDEWPGVSQRLERVEWHLGNGASTPLHEEMRDLIQARRDALAEHERTMHAGRQ